MLYLPSIEIVLISGVLFWVLPILQPALPFQIYTIFAFVMAIPFALAFEGRAIYGKWQDILRLQSFTQPVASKATGNSELILTEMHLITGLLFFLYVNFVEIC